MNVQLLIDGIVRQTTVLIAQLATTAGVRAPLAHVANQVFLDLVTELEGQGVGRKVVADMFGLALRSYQQKVHRLHESATQRGKTLWQAVYEFIRTTDGASRHSVLARFRHDDEAMVRSVLADLCDTGLVHRSGRGPEASYSAVDEPALDGTAPDSHEARKALVWMAVYRKGELTSDDAAQLAPGNHDPVLALLEELASEGRLVRRVADGSPVWTCQEYSVGLGETHGFEAAVFDHYQSVVTAICTKLRNGKTQALPADRIGGSTFTYDIWPGHPLEARAYAQLGRMRAEAGALWEEIEAYNATADRDSDDVDRVTFYCGQSIAAAREEDSQV
jgi:hypothetical protein